MPTEIDKLLSPEDAKAVLQKNLTNIVKKSAAGKTLSTKELAIVESAIGAAGTEAGPEFVRSYEELGAIFGPHRASFPRFRKQFKDAPKAKANGLHSVPEWRQFFTRHPECLVKAIAAGEADAVPGSRRAKIEDEQWRKLKIANDHRDGILISKSEVGGKLRTLAETQRGICRQKLENEYPALIPGLTPEQRAELRKRGKELVDDLAKRMQRLVDAWKF